MPDSEQQRLRERALLFFGRIVAGQTHELTNVLNVINELTGLQADMLEGASQGRAVDLEKLWQIAEKTSQQLHRGESILRAVNRFAHSADSPVCLFDAREAVEHIVGLAQRSAYLVKTTLEADLSAVSLPLETSLFGFEQAVFNCIEMALRASAQKRRVTVSYRPREAGVEIAVSSADPIPADAGLTAGCKALGLLVGRLGGLVSTQPDGSDRHCLTLFFPSPASRRADGGDAAAGHRAEDRRED